MAARRDSVTEVVHVIDDRTETFDEQGYATRTRCGLRFEEPPPHCGDPVPRIPAAMWPGEGLRGWHWGEPYRVDGRWCRRCRRRRKT